MADLQLLTLHIENFKSFSGSHEFELGRQPGLYYVTGRNDLAPELGANGVGKSTLFDAMLWCLWGKTGRDNRPANAIQPWGKKGSTRVSLLFTKKGQTICLARTRAPNRLGVWHDLGLGHPSPDKDFKEIQQDEVPGLIGMSEEMFRRTLILGQFGQLFLDLKPEAQSQMFTEALSLDVWMRAAQLAGDAEKAASQAKAKAETDLTVCKALLDNLSSQIETSAEEARRFETDKAARIAKIEKGIATLESDLENLEEVKEPELPKDQEHARLALELGDKRTDLAIQGRVVRDAQAAKVRADEALAVLQRQVKAKQKTCPACGQPISLKEFNEKLDAARQAQEQAAHHLAADIKKSKAIADEVTKAERDLEAQAAQSQKANDAYRQKMDAYNDYCVELRAIQRELQRQKSQLRLEQTTTNEFQRMVDVTKERRQTKRAEKAALEEKLEGLGTKIEEAKFWADAYREIRLGVIDEALIELEMASSRHAAMLGLNDWGIRFDTERETKSGQVSYGFTVMLYPPGEEQPVKFEAYSGGESQRWQLAVSFALSEVLLARAGLSPNVEILDEPTRGLSADGVADLLEHLRDRALELGRAIYFIDHHSLDKGAFDGTLLITKGKKGSSATWL